MEAREGGGPRGASPHRARGAGEGIADALSREMRRAAAEDLEADYFFDCRNAVDEEIELRAQAATAQEVKEEGAAMGAAETELFVETPGVTALKVIHIRRDGIAFFKRRRGRC